MLRLSVTFWWPTVPFLLLCRFVTHSRTRSMRFCVSILLNRVLSVTCSKMSQVGSSNLPRYVSTLQKLFWLSKHCMSTKFSTATSSPKTFFSRTMDISCWPIWVSLDSITKTSTLNLPRETKSHLMANKTKPRMQTKRIPLLLLLPPPPITTTTQNRRPRQLLLTISMPMLSPQPTLRTPRLRSPRKQLRRAIALTRPSLKRLQIPRSWHRRHRVTT
mmetsp:Transcript_7641/g.15169  ORF Transcript_7641/g.15169 Transcript_7641/m.15169 type:complete len:217 (-) Transcript_7641:1155-1805(-)